MHGVLWVFLGPPVLLYAPEALADKLEAIEGPDSG